MNFGFLCLSFCSLFVLGSSLVIPSTGGDIKVDAKMYFSHQEHSPHLLEFSRQGSNEGHTFWSYVDQQATILYGMDVEKQGVNSTLVTIGERHNSVLYHWIGLAHSGTIERKGVTLIHIDSHSDLMIPPVSLGHGWPWDGYSLTHSSNIATFIFAAAQVGLINHVIWLRPVWKENTKLWNFPQKFGTYPVRIGQSDTMLLCYFQENGLQLDGDSCDSKSLYLFSIMLTVAPLNNTVLSDVTTYYEHYHPQLANWKNGPVILDIDLDFFSCVDSTQTLTIRTTGIENSLYKKIRKTAIALNDECCSKRSAAKNLALDIARLISRRNNTSAERKMLYLKHRSSWCAKDTAMEYLNELNAHMMSLTEWQRWSILLNLLNLEGEPHEMRSALPFGNIHLIEPEHISTAKELDETFNALRQALKGIQPSVIAITRSIWDGYLPLNLWPKIEDDTLATLIDLYGSLKIRWDRGLSPTKELLSRFDISKLMN